MSLLPLTDLDLLPPEHKKNKKPSHLPQFVVHEAPGQEMELEIFDEDTDKDDFIGR